MSDWTIGLLLLMYLILLGLVAGVAWRSYLKKRRKKDE